MKGFADNIEALTRENTDFRRVLYTARNMQLVLMALKPADEIGEEVHEDRDQLFRVEQGAVKIRHRWRRKSPCRTRRSTM